MDVLSPVLEVLQLGGPVVAVLGVISILTLAIALYTFWQFRMAGVGRHRAIKQALAHWDRGDLEQAGSALSTSTSYLAPIIHDAMTCEPSAPMRQRLEAESETLFLKLEKRFRWLDVVAQLAPLLGLFGTVLGMIDAFQALQSAGDSVDPSVLAGGIWVALLTTAVGLAVAMPTAMVLASFDARMEAERVFADAALATLFAPKVQASDPARNVA